MAKINLLIFLILLSSFCPACSLNSPSPELRREPASRSDREDNVKFFSHMHTLLRDTERSTYNLMYGVRDDIDSFIYDTQKDYYKDYQK